MSELLTEKEVRELLCLNEIVGPPNPNTPNHPVTPDFVKRTTTVLRYAPIESMEDQKIFLCAICELLQEHMDIGLDGKTLEVSFVNSLSYRDYDPISGGEFIRAFQSCERENLIKETILDEWEPGMRSGTGRVRRYSATAYGKKLVQKSILESEAVKQGQGEEPTKVRLYDELLRLSKITDELSESLLVSPWGYCFTIEASPDPQRTEKAFCELEDLLSGSYWKELLEHWHDEAAWPPGTNIEPFRTAYRAYEQGQEFVFKVRAYHYKHGELGDFTCGLVSGSVRYDCISELRRYCEEGVELAEREPEVREHIRQKALQSLNIKANEAATPEQNTVGRHYVCARTSWMGDGFSCLARFDGTVDEAEAFIPILKPYCSDKNIEPLIIPASNTAQAKACQIQLDSGIGLSDYGIMDLKSVVDELLKATSHEPQAVTSQATEGQYPEATPGIDQLRKIDTQNVMVIHYSSSDHWSKSPEIRCIAVRSLCNGDMKRFNVSDDVNESEALSKFYAFVQSHPDKVWIHWHMSTSFYGFDAIEERFRVLGGDPVTIPSKMRVNLAETLRMIYGRDYAPDPQLYNIAQMNKIDTRYFLQGDDEKILDPLIDSTTLAASTERKAMIIGEIFKLTVDGKLIVSGDATAKTRATEITGEEPATEKVVSTLEAEENQADDTGQDEELAAIAAKIKPTEKGPTPESKKQESNQRTWTKQSVTAAIRPHITKNSNLSLSNLVELTKAPRSTIAATQAWKDYVAAKKAGSAHRGTVESIDPDTFIVSDEDERQAEIDRLKSEQDREQMLDDCGISQKRL